MIYLILNGFTAGLKLLALISVFQVQINNYEIKKDVYINFIDTVYFIDSSSSYETEEEDITVFPEDSSYSEEGRYFSKLETRNDSIHIDVSIRHREDFIMYMVFHELFHFKNYLEQLNDPSVPDWTEKEVDEKTYQFLNLYKND